eukprot:gene52949-64681_t
MKKIAFIGLGNMGLPMARNLLKAGHELKVFDLVQSAVDELVAEGAKAANDAHDAVSGVEIVVSMLPASQHVEGLFLGAGELLAQLPAGTLVIDCSTIAAATSRKVAEAAKAKGVAVGAHPGFPDLWGFGRRRMPFTAGEIERLVAYQVGAAQALATYSGHRITYVKTHGALGNIAEQEPEIAQAVARAVKA